MTGRLAFPVLDWLPGYRKEWLRADVVAGLITAAVVIPKAMAYATIAGLPVQIGLYTALVPMVDLRGPRDVPPAERQHDHDDRHPDGGPARESRRMQTRRP